MKKQQIDLNHKTILVTGSPGFIGANLVLRLLKEMTSGQVISFDNMNNYYDPEIKKYRLSLIEEAAKSTGAKHQFVQGDLADKGLIDHIFQTYHPDIVVNLAAQAGVRYSMPIFSQIWLDFIIFWKPAGILMTTGHPVWHIWSMRPVLLCMAATRKCRFPQMIGWIIRYLFTRQRKRAMN